MAFSKSFEYYEKKQPSIFEALSRRFVDQFLSSFISTGCLTLHEEGGSGLTYDGIDDKCAINVELKIHDPQFYWKVMTRADIGLADAYIDGDFSFPDEQQGLLNFVRLLIANRDAKTPNKTRGWWTPIFFMATVVSTKLFYHHVLRANTLTQARRNISRHYDMKSEVFALFLGETMQYSCGIFKNKDEDLYTAQMRKISILIEKARINKDHKVLDIGCGWGTLAVETVKRTGCQYVGITLSEEQLRFAKTKVKQASLQNHITLLLCDYRNLPKGEKFDRIISCEMLEHVGHEYMEEFFGCAESLLAKDGLFVLQFSSMVDERYEQYRRSTDFIKEYIFPGGSVPSLSRVIAAMANASTLSVEHAENIGSHFYRTLRLWRQNFLDNRSKILDFGFDEKFIRTWEYYFDYSAAGFKSYTLANYQVVFSRPGNIKALGDPYKAFPSQFDPVATS